VTAEDIAAVTQVLASDRLAQGMQAGHLQEDLETALGADHAVVCSSGTAALHLAKMAMELKPEDYVITTPLTFCATANMILACGAIPLFADVDPETLNIDPAQVKKLIEELKRKGEFPQLKGILAMHYGGRPCDMSALRELANEHGLWLVEDACHALGGRYLDNSRVGSVYADLSCWSFHPAKHVAAGEGGAVTTSRHDLPGRLGALRDHGRGSFSGDMRHLGYNYRMDEMSAALARSQLRRLRANVTRLWHLSNLYDEQLPDGVRKPLSCVGSAWHLYPVRVANRDGLRAFLGERLIGTQVHYQPVHLLPYYQALGRWTRGQCPVAEQAWSELLSLPMFASMTDDDVERVCTAVWEFYRKGA